MWLPLIWTAIGVTIGVSAAALLRGLGRSTLASGSELSAAPQTGQHGPALDTHLVLNVLNRFAAQLTDEHLQDGLEALGHYVAALGRDAKLALERDYMPLGECPEAYWRLTEWIHDKPKSRWELRCLSDLREKHRATVREFLLSTLQCLEHTSAQELEISVAEGKGSNGTVVLLTVVVQQPGPKLPKPSSTLPWRRLPNGYGVTVEVSFS